MPKLIFPVLNKTRFKLPFDFVHGVNQSVRVLDLQVYEYLQPDYEHGQFPPPGSTVYPDIDKENNFVRSTAPYACYLQILTTDNEFFVGMSGSTFVPSNKFKLNLENFKKNELNETGYYPTIGYGAVAIKNLNFTSFFDPNVVPANFVNATLEYEISFPPCGYWHTYDIIVISKSIESFRKPRDVTFLYILDKKTNHVFKISDTTIFGKAIMNLYSLEDELLKYKSCISYGFNLDQYFAKETDKNKAILPNFSDEPHYVLRYLYDEAKEIDKEHEGEKNYKKFPQPVPEGLPEKGFYLLLELEWDNLDDQINKMNDIIKEWENLSEFL